MALAETSPFLQPYVYFMLADPAMSIRPTYVAAGYPLCKPFDLFVGTYRLSSHARLKAFVIQTKLNPL
jgi:hypothetical protein